MRLIHGLVIRHIAESLEPDELFVALVAEPIADFLGGFVAGGRDVELTTASRDEQR